MPAKPDLLNLGGVEHHSGGHVTLGRVVCEVLTWLRFQGQAMTLD